MLSPFRAVLARPGAPGLALACLLGWLSAAGAPLAVVLAVHHVTHSFALAGAASATQALAAGVFAPLRGRFVDRRGGSALAILVAGLIGGVSLFVWGCQAQLDPALLAGAGVLGSFTLPLIGVARSIWPTIAGPQLTAAAHALNAATSDCAALGAPALVAGVSIVASPVVALVMLGTGACLAAGLIVRTGISPHPGDGPPGRDLPAVLRGNAGLQAIIVGDFAMGAWTGGMAIVVVALAARQGNASLGSLLLAASALGSIVMSLLAGGGVLKARAVTRYLAGGWLSVVGLLALVLAGSWPTVVVALIAAGAGLGLENVAVFEVLDLVSPRGRSTETFAWLTTASAAGGALGAALSGRLVEQSTIAARLLILAAALGGVLAYELLTCRASARNAR